LRKLKLEAGNDTWENFLITPRFIPSSNL